MMAGKLDRRVLIEAPTFSNDSIGASTTTWATLATVWARVEHLAGKELYAAKQIIPTADLKITIRYRSDITEKMRVTHDGVVYGIQHIAEIGRRDGLAILVQRPK